MNDQLLSLVSQYGAPALFGIVAIAAVGAPLPIMLLLIVAGSMVAQGAMNLWWVIGAASAGSILGDQAGYAIGRWGGQAAISWLRRAFGKGMDIQAVEAKARKWGGPGIFLTRWLLSPLGPWINLASGTAAYPWHKFLFWDALGETTSAILFISIGRIFSDRVLAMDAILGNLTWAVVALLAAMILGYRLLASRRRLYSQGTAGESQT
jgi:membrane protein DedA with SNARE-associated domain